MSTEFKKEHVEFLRGISMHLGATDATTSEEDETLSLIIDEIEGMVTESETWHEVALELYPDGQGDENNATKVSRSIQAFHPSYDGDTLLSGLVDALVDIRHLCDLMGWSMANIDRQAQTSYSQEVHEFGVAKHDRLRAAIKRDLL